MKRLFSVRTTQAAKGTNAGVFFASKPQAKEHRDKCNASDNKRTWVVCRGPDHLRGVS